MLVKHILFNESWEGIEGKEGWISFQHNIITEHELRHLVIAHSATKISQFNNKIEPNYEQYSSEKLLSNFQKSLFG